MVALIGSMAARQVGFSAPNHVMAKA
jgi:hypothetical protein